MLCILPRFSSSVFFQRFKPGIGVVGHWITFRGKSVLALLPISPANLIHDRRLGIRQIGLLEWIAVGIDPIASITHENHHEFDEYPHAHNEQRDDTDDDP